MTPQAITAATDVVAKALAGDITTAAAAVLLKAALRLEDAEVQAMLAGIDAEREKRKAENEAKAKAIAGGQGAVPPGGPMPPKGRGMMDPPEPKDPPELPPRGKGAKP